jgi:Flp pilus assembly protein TadD
METGLSHSKGDVNMLKDYINLLYQNRNYSKAAEKINEAIKLEPNNEILYVFLGQIYEQTNKPTEAEEQYKKALQLNPNNYEVVKIIGINLYNQAVKINKDANEIPAEKQAEYDAMIKKRNEVLEKAFPYLEKAKQIKPDDEETTRPYEKTKALLKK